MTVGGLDKYGKPVVDARCKSEELTDNGDGTYSFVRENAGDSLGHLCSVIVADRPGKVLFWDADLGILYDWTGDSRESGTGGGDDP